MIRIIFVCHGNICRSPMAEYIMKHIVSLAGYSDRFEIASAAATTEEIGSDIYPPAKQELRKHNIPFERRRARLLRHDEYSRWDYVIAMDWENLEDIAYIFGHDHTDNVKLLMSFTGENRAVADPWYTRDFDAAYRDIYAGCSALLEECIS